MRGGPWLAVLEAYLVQRLLRSPAFHRAIGKAHKSVHRMRHGIPPEEMGGTKLDTPAGQGFVSHFIDELKGQALGGKSAAKSPSSTAPPAQAQAQPRPSHPNNSPQNQQGFLSHFVDELKTQFRDGSRK